MSARHAERHAPSITAQQQETQQACSTQTQVAWRSSVGSVLAREQRSKTQQSSRQYQELRQQARERPTQLLRPSLHVTLQQCAGIPPAPSRQHPRTPCCAVLCCLLRSGYLNTNVWEYKENIEAMVDKLKAKGVENIVVLVPPPVRGSTAQSLAEVVSVLGAPFMFRTAYGTSLGRLLLAAACCGMPWPGKSCAVAAF